MHRIKTSLNEECYNTLYVANALEEFLIVIIKKILGDEARSPNMPPGKGLFDPVSLYPTPELAYVESSSYQTLVVIQPL